MSLIYQPARADGLSHGLGLIGAVALVAAGLVDGTAASRDASPTPL
jgi:hypothetical protein